MARNQLPEGVGKKIVEALKRQAEADITPVSPQEQNTIVETGAQSFNDADFADFKDAAPQAASPVQPEKKDAAPMFDIKFKDETAASQLEKEPYQPMSFDLQAKKDDIYNPAPKETFSASMFNLQQNKREDFFAQPAQESYANTAFNLQNKRETAGQEASFKSANESVTPISYAAQAPSSGILSYSGVPFSEEQKMASAAPVISVNIPTNVAVLKNLIASLPVGVTKQTGAQIIRQTLEAMGLPMASVLKEAQEVQEELNTNTRECMLKIQEFKTNIMQLEQSVQEYQKNMTQINDLVSLFLLTDRK